MWALAHKYSKFQVSWPFFLFFSICNKEVKKWLFSQKPVQLWWKSCTKLTSRDEFISCSKMRKKQTLCSTNWKYTLFIIILESMWNSQVLFSSKSFFTQLVVYFLVVVKSCTKLTSRNAFISCSKMPKKQTFCRTNWKDTLFIYILKSIENSQSLIVKANWWILW